MLFRDTFCHSYAISSSKGGADEGFTGSAYQERIAKSCELREFLEQLEILREAFAETDAGVEDDLRFGDTGFQGDGN